jgi:hypothetical protein
MIKSGPDGMQDGNDGERRIRRSDAGVTRVQTKYEQLARGRDMIDELLAERREEAARKRPAD